MGESKKIGERKVLGVALMLLGLFIYPIGDAASKFLTDDYSTLMLSWAKFAIGAIILIPIALIKKSRPIKLSKRLIIEQVLRAALIVTATLFFIAALTTIPLADTVGAYFIAPIIAAVLSVIILREKLSAGKVIATILGFVGMILIVRPGASMEIGFIYALAAGLCFGSFMVATKWSIHDVPAIKTVAFQTLFGTVLLTPFIIGEISSLKSSEFDLFLIVGLGSAIANILTISALRLAPTSLLAPLVYFEIVGAALFGYLVFGDIPSLMTFIGIGIVIFSGLLLIERKS